jgi:hypothetical protein
MMKPPASRMDVLTDAEVGSLLASSKLAAKYNKDVDSESAYEILNNKLAAAQQQTEAAEAPVQPQQTASKGRSPKEESWMDNPMVRSAGRTAATIITRSLLGVLGLGGSTRKRKGSLF